MAKNSCELYPIVKGKPSKLYKDLLKVTGNRPKLITSMQSTSNRG